MSFDLRVLVVGQEKPKKYDTRIKIVDETQENLRYLTWPFLSSQDGIMYSLGTIENELFNAMNLIETSFEETDRIPFWIKDEDIKSNLTDMVFLDDYKNDLIDVLQQMINSSPKNLILFLARYQGGDKEIFFGSMTLIEFIDALNKGELLFNTCYIISNKV